MRSTATNETYYTAPDPDQPQRYDTGRGISLDDDDYYASPTGEPEYGFAAAKPIDAPMYDSAGADGPPDVTYDLAGFAEV
eukprot:m.180770 g.180770  ORF g.180770 m.180770 type:complete len:80 (+) comp15502_c0_seq9:1277-1516(+)